MRTIHAKDETDSEARKADDPGDPDRPRYIAANEPISASDEEQALLRRIELALEPLQPLQPPRSPQRPSSNDAGGAERAERAERATSNTGMGATPGVDTTVDKAAGTHAFTLVTADGEAIPLPESVAVALRRIAHDLGRNRAVAITSFNRELTTYQAAAILNVSRPFLIKLLEQGAIPYVKTGTHRRIRFDDLMAYKRHRDAERRQPLDRLARMSGALDVDEADIAALYRPD
jgi:excisionase family DNA binding protein